MSTHTTTPAAAATSPKVKSAGIWGAAVVILGPALAAGILAIPKDAFDSLGVWALPVGVFVGAIGASLAAVTGAYQKGDPLRNLGGAVADMGGTAVPVVAPEVEPAPADLPEVVEDPAPVDEGESVADHLLTQVDELTAARSRSGSTKDGGVS